MAKRKYTGRPKAPAPNASEPKKAASEKETPKKAVTERKGGFTGIPNRAITSCSIGRRILGNIKKPHKTRATKEQKEFFRSFIKRLEERDKKMDEKEKLDRNDGAGQQPVILVSSDLNDEWEVEEILDITINNRVIYFMVLWKGYMLKECTWETEKALSKNCQDAIDEFYTAFPNKTGVLGRIKPQTGKIPEKKTERGKEEEKTEDREREDENDE